MKLAGKRIDAFVRRPDPAVRAVLVYGPDSGLVRERATLLGRSAVEDLSNPFRVAELAASAVTEDPARLVDEANAMSLIGGRRLVRVRDATDKLAPAAKALLAAHSGDSLVVFEAGDLGNRSTLRKLFEESDSAAALPCYVEEEGELGQTIQDALREAGYQIDVEGASVLANALVGDRQVMRREIEKLQLYMGDERRITLADVQACIGDAADLSTDDAAMACCDGDPPALDRALQRLFAQGESPIAVLRAAQRQMLRLHQVQAAAAGGKSLEQAVATLRPPLFFKVKDAFLRQLRLWNLAGAATALARLNAAEAACKRTGAPAEILAGQALMELALRARAQRSRQGMR
ncbi:MAG TPA: DNA polymerase III subunit delta [Alphaproteobacteria bacterium]|nr:DNA polymerase III subunit delta [Alphaproteobacteria bacterium]